VHDLLLERERRAALVRERRVRDRPAPVELTDEVVARVRTKLEIWSSLRD